MGVGGFGLLERRGERLTEWLRFSSVFSLKKLIICQDLHVPKERQQTQVSVQKKDANLGHQAMGSIVNPTLSQKKAERGPPAPPA